MDPTEKVSYSTNSFDKLDLYKRVFIAFVGLLPSIPNHLHHSPCTSTSTPTRARHAGLRRHILHCFGGLIDHVRITLQLLHGLWQKQPGFHLFGEKVHSKRKKKQLATWKNGWGWIDEVVGSLKSPWNEHIPISNGWGWMTIFQLQDAHLFAFAASCSFQGKVCFYMGIQRYPLKWQETAQEIAKPALRGSTLR